MRRLSTIAMPALLIMSACGPAPMVDEQADAASATPPALPQERHQDIAAPMPPVVTAKPSGRARSPVPDLTPLDDDYEPVEVFPVEVTAFMVDRDRCDHFRGEEAYDPERRAFLQASINQLCVGTDARLAILRARHATDPNVIAALDNYDDRIEQARTREGLFDPILRDAP